MTRPNNGPDETVNARPRSDNSDPSADNTGRGPTETPAPSPTPTPKGPTLKSTGLACVTVGAGVIALSGVIMLIGNRCAVEAGLILGSAGVVIVGLGCILLGIGKIKESR
jgi:hypothetical protein